MPHRIQLWSIDRSGSLEVGRPRLAWDNWFTCVATLDVAGEFSSVELGMITPYRHFWVDWAIDVAAPPQSWRGDKRWDSEHGEMSIACVAKSRDEVDAWISMYEGPGSDRERQEHLVF